MSEELAIQRKKELKKKNLQRKLKSTLPNILKKTIIGFLVFLIIYLVATTKLFNIAEFNIEPYKEGYFEYIEEDAVRSYISTEYLGQNYFALDIARLRESVVESSTFIETVYLEKVFPNGVDVFIEEKVPMLVVEADAKCILISKNNGVILAENYEVDDSGDENRIYCEALSDRYQVSIAKLEYKFQDTVTERDGFFMFDELFQSIGLMEDNGLDIAHIRMSSERAIFVTEDGRKVYMDLLNDFEKQLKRLVLVLNQSKIDRIEYKEVDVRYDRPVTRK